MTVKSPDGFVWADHGSSSDDHLAWGGHEPALAPVMYDNITSKKEYINVGSHVGLWSIRMAEHSAHVYAVEGNPNTFRTLEENIELNRLENKVTPLNVVLWDETGVVVSPIDLNGKSSGGSTRFEETKNGQTTHTLDSVFLYNDAADIGLISMDVEGAEARILRGGKQLIKKHRPNLIIELHENHPGTDSDLRKQVYDFLDEVNYTHTSFKGSPPEEHLICTPNEFVHFKSDPETVLPGMENIPNDFMVQLTSKKGD